MHLGWYPELLALRFGPTTSSQPQMDARHAPVTDSPPRFHAPGSEPKPNEPQLITVNFTYAEQ
jgi:hypothetical protein